MSDQVGTGQRNKDIPQGSEWLLRVCGNEAQIEGGGGLVTIYQITTGWQRMHHSVEDSYRWQRHLCPSKTVIVVRRIS